MAETIWGFESRAMFEHRPGSVVTVLSGLVLLFSSTALAPQQVSSGAGQGAAVSGIAKSAVRGRPARASGGRFVPSQSVSADKSLSFPIDI
jgi:hypothetical protein